MANGPFIPYLTVAGDRWDLIAWKFYGDPTLYGPIIVANPAIAISGAFDPGVTLQIPILQRASAAAPSELPPWETL